MRKDCGRHSGGRRETGQTRLPARVPAFSPAQKTIPLRRASERAYGIFNVYRVAEIVALNSALGAVTVIRDVDASRWM